jgi:hypothetical protein
MKANSKNLFEQGMKHNSIEDDEWIVRKTSLRYIFYCYCMNEGKPSGNKKIFFNLCLKQKERKSLNDREANFIFS